MKKRIIAILLSVTCLLGLAGCGSTPKTMETPQYETEETKEEENEILYDEPGETRPEVVEKSILKKGINQFGFAIYDRLDNNENSFYSPYSLCSALSLLDLGAGSTTKEELEKVLGIEDLDAWKWAMRDYLEKEWSEETYLLTANAIWMDENKDWSEKIEEEFIAPAKAFFQGEIKKKDFLKSEEVIEDVNNWAKENTKGMIPKVLNTLPEDARMLLANAVYFDGKWEKPFLAEDSREDIFYGLSGEEKITSMNQYGEHYAYICQDGIKGIALPYKNSTVVMKVFIPEDEGDNIGELLGKLSLEERLALMDSLDEAGKEEIRRLAFPKFEYEKELEGLDDILKDMGIVSAYREDADLDKMAEDLYVSNVLHKAKIEVDEQGTKAAAVTIVVVNETCAMEEPVYIDFIVDSPFFFVIEDTQTGVILFMGQINTFQK